MSGDEINAYYTTIRSDGLKGTTAQRHHAMLHRAFQQAVKRRIIPTNPCLQADRPKSVPFIGSYYNAEELKTLLNCVEGDPIRLVIMLAAYYGLRRSEVLGLKWSAVDFTAKTVSIRHKILEEETKSGIVLKGYDVMKTKSSYRTLPLIPHIEEELLAEQARQEEMRTVMRGAYDKKYSEYICVDALGGLITPQYVSSHFQVILKENGLRKIRFHDLRHSCASLLLANNIPMKMIQDWLGHSDMATTANIYSHIDSSSELASANMIEEVLGVTDDEDNPENDKDEKPE
ncbi:Tyrosine recombinase XerC [Caprobacter fermentans]|uniref:Tyrosine recombinase XerC n=1 Tax=Caproicibacter fermentans TaxID=2576756 RepID=A0A6N8HVT1_9FIRM|nr:site-specific integrase [Caproicibacter fermentans]MVB09670.1 Tyrosine recombinase XerC [Caproicibacter fermentans]